jgi:uncharacterized membrane protein required for colicin V production
MNSILGHLPINWFDLVVMALLLLGILHGRKSGMSAELLPLLEWLCIVGAGAFLYEILGQALAGYTRVGPLYCYLVAYIGVAIGAKVAFSVLKRLFGGKLVGSDVFGKGEYYLGMVAGMARFACVVLVGLALLNAREFTQDEKEKDKNMQKDVYGSDFFPRLYTVQDHVFDRSVAGRLVKEHLNMLLIKPTRPGGGSFQRRELETL